MINLTIDNIPIQVPIGTTVLNAAAALGIRIPAMCYLEGHSCHPSCMVCMVKDTDKGNFFPSCAMPVAEGMNIVATSTEVSNMRREALELLLSDHVGDCEAPCTLTCPAGMNIPLMNRLIAAGEIEKALEIVYADIALPLTLGYICPAPCEKACRRKPIDGAVSICLLKRFTALEPEIRSRNLKIQHPKSGKRIAIIGSGPAGLSAAFYLLRAGHDCTLFDKNDKAGGALRYSIPEERLPSIILDADIDSIRQMGAVFNMGMNVSPQYFEDVILITFDAVVLATGNRANQRIEDFGLQSDKSNEIADKKTMQTKLPGVFACGNILREQNMAVRAAAQGKVAAESVSYYLKTKEKENPLQFNSSFGPLTNAEQQEYLKAATPDARTEPKAGFIAGFDEQEATAEAKRCLHCDCRKPLTCKLRLYADVYRANRRSHLDPERKPLTKEFHHDLIVYEPEKCICCGLCVEISSADETLGLTYVGRGFNISIGVPFSQNIAEALKTTALKCIDACPTGAMGIKKQ